MQNVLLVVDTSNIKYCLDRTFGNGKMNYAKYREDAVGTDIVFASIAYGRNFGDIQWPFCKTLKCLGFEIKFKDGVLRKSGDIQSEKWVGWNVGIAVDIMNAIHNSAGKIDKVIIGSSEPELIHVVEYLRSRHMPVEIFACGIPRLIRDAATSCRDIGPEYLLNAAANTSKDAE